MTTQTYGILLMVTLGIISIYLIVKYMKNILPYKKYVDLFFLLYAIESMVRHYWWWYERGQPFRFIPFQICYLTMYIYMYFYFSKDRRMLPFLHIMGFLGFGALISPGITFEFTNVWSYVFMLDHIVIAVMPFYVIAANKYYPKFGAIKTNLYLLIPLFVISIPLSNWTGENFFFLISNPITNDILSPWFVMIIQLFFIVIFGILATYIGQYINRELKQDQN